MKKIMIAALAALMLAGALSAASDAASILSSQSVAVVGEGPSPFPMPIALSANSPTGDSTSVGTQF
jgi:hypothetical protein